MSDSSSEINPLDALAEEFVARHRRGEQPAVSEYTAKYPALADDIRELFPALVLMEDVRPEKGEATGAFDSESSATNGKTLERLGDYRILREVGRGGMGIVYEAEQESLGRHVALKVLPSHALLDPQRLRRFQREAKAAARLHHTNIVPVFGVGETDGLHYYVMQFIHGLGLDQVLVELRKLRHEPAPPVNTRSGELSAADVARSLWTGHFAPTGSVADGEGEAPAGPDIKGPAEAAPSLSSTSDSALHLPGQADSVTPSHSGRAYWQSVARTGVQVAEALAYAHQQGVLHRDIKPSNLLLDGKGTVWVTDFGLAKAADSEDLTHTGDIVGTLRYMAPERFNSPGDALSDIYGLGLTLYELLTLRPGFAETDRNKLIAQVTHEEPPPPRKLNPEVPRDLETIVLKAIAREPAHRYASAAELAADLQRFVEDRPIQARRASVRERLWRWCRRNPNLASVTAALVLVILAGNVLVTWKWWEAAVQERKATWARIDAEEAQKKAEANADENRRRIGEQYVANGLRLMDQGDLSGALLWFAEALKQDEHDPERAALHRLRLGTLLRECPRPERVWFHDAKVNDAAYSPDGRWLLTACDDKTARVWGASTGEPVAVLPHDQPVVQIKFSGDGRRVLTVSGQAGSALSFGQELKQQAQVWDTATWKALTPPLKHVQVMGGTGEASLLSPDGGRLFTCPDSKTVQVWQADTGQPAGPPLKHTWNIRTAVFVRSDGSQVFTLSSEGSLYDLGSTEGTGEARTWDVVRGEPIAASPKLTGTFWYVDASPDGRRVSSIDPAGLRVWETAMARTLWSYTRSNQSVWGGKFSPDGRYVVLGSMDSYRGIMTWQVVDAGTGRSVSQQTELFSQIYTDAAFSPDGRRLVVPGPDNTARVLDAATGQPVAPLLRHETALFLLKFSPDGRRVLTVSADNAARLWEAASGLPMTPFLKHEGGVSQALFSPDGRHVLTLSGNAARAWPLSALPSNSLLLKPRGSVSTALFSPDGRWVFTLSSEPGKQNVATLWDAATGRQVPLTLPFPAENSNYQASFSKDGRWVLIISQTYAGSGSAPVPADVWVWEVATGRLASKFRCEGGCAQAVFSPDGRRVLTGHNDGTARVWDSQTGAAVTSALRHVEKGTVQIGFSPDGGRVFTFYSWSWGTTDEKPAAAEVRVWDATSGEQVGKAIKLAGDTPPTEFRPESSLQQVVFTPDGRRVLTVLGDSTAQVWDVATGQAVFAPLRLGGGFMGPGGSATAFSPDGRRVLTYGGEWGKNGQARVLDAETGEPVTPLLPHENLVQHAAFSPDGRHVVTASMDGTARVWDAATGEPRTPPLKHAGPVSWASFSPDGRRVQTISNRGWNPLFGTGQETEARLWDAATGQPLTPPLRSLAAGNTWSGGAGAEGMAVRFSPDGGRVLLVRPDLALEVRELASDPHPVDELLMWTRVLSGRRVNDAGSIMPLEADRFQLGWQSLGAKHQREFAWTAPGVNDWHRHEVEACMAPGAMMGFFPTGTAGTVNDASAAVWHLDRLLKAEPDNAHWRTLRGKAYAALGRWEDAVADYGKAIAAAGDDAPWYDRGATYVQLGKWEQAADDFARAVRAKNAPAEAWTALALVRLHLGEGQGYRDACAALLERHGKTASWVGGISLVRIFTAGPDAVKDFTPLTRLAENNPTSYGYGSPVPASKAAVHYRAGRHEDAARLLTEVVEGKVAVPAQDCFFLAMARHRLGQVKEARQALTQGIERLKQVEQERGQDSPPVALRIWQERLEEQLLRREAEALIRPDKP